MAEPLFWALPQGESREAACRAADHGEASVEAIDFIMSADCAAIDVLGFNHYPHNQWVEGADQLAIEWTT